MLVDTSNGGSSNPAQGPSPIRVHNTSSESQATTHPVASSPARSRYHLQDSSQEVVMRRQRNGHSQASVHNNGYDHHQVEGHNNKAGGKRSSEPGGLLKLALEHHFKDPEACRADLDRYLVQVFNQLDYHNSKTVSREDFDTLCEVLGIADDQQPNGSSPTNAAPSFYRYYHAIWHIFYCSVILHHSFGTILF